MAPLQKVVVFGATGNIGRPIVSALLDNGFIVTAVTRSASIDIQHPRSSDLRLGKVDLSSKSELVAILKGQDAIIEAFPPATAEDYQATIVESAIEAGIKHIITPEFAGDTFNPFVSELWNYAPKVAAQRQLEDVITRQGSQIKWTGVVTGPWYDWAIENDFFWVNGLRKTIKVFGSGNQRYSMASVRTISTAVVEILSQPEQVSYYNRPVYVADHTVSTNDLISMLETISPGWTVERLFQDDVGKLYEIGKDQWETDTRDANGAKIDRLKTQAYASIGTYGLFEESNRYGADFEDKVDIKWRRGVNDLREKLKQLISPA